MVGLPAAWLLFKTKEVPPVSSGELASLLRIQAETDFPSDLKDMVFDYVAPGDGQEGKLSGEVQLLATPRRYIEAASKLCDDAGLHCAAVTASAFVLGAATQASRVKASLVLAVGPCGAELTAQGGAGTSAVRRLRGQDNPAMFMSELRRAAPTFGHNGSDGGLVMWDGMGLDAAAVGKSLELAVRQGVLTDLGATLDLPANDGRGPHNMRRLWPWGWRGSERGICRRIFCNRGWPSRTNAACPNGCCWR